MDQHGLVLREVETVTSGHPRSFPLGGETHAHPGDHSSFPGPASLKGKGRIAFIWGISGTVLSAAGFIAMALFEQYNDSLNELRRDLKHFNETSAELVKKDSMRRCFDQLKECFKEVHASAAARAQLERELRASEEERKELTHELQRVRERLASVEGRQAATAVVVPLPPAKK
jgi:hypothetical protein